MSLIRGQYQISIGLIGLGLTVLGFVITPVVGYFKGESANNEKIYDLSTRTAVLENSIQNTDRNVLEIKDDLKDIKKAFNIQ